MNHRRLTFMDDGASFSLDFKSDHFDTPPYSGVTVLRSRFDAWLAGKVQEAIDASARGRRVAPRHRHPRATR